jgi:hypothetical protein
VSEITFGITLDEAKALRQGELLNAQHWLTHEPMLNADGTLARYKVTSVKTWKRDPDRVEVRVQRGLREFHVLKSGDLPNLRKARA